MHFAEGPCSVAAAGMQGGLGGHGRAPLQSSAHGQWGRAPSCKGPAPPWTYLQNASLNNHKREQSNLLLQEKEQTLPWQMRFQKVCRFCGRESCWGAGAEERWEWGVGVLFCNLFLPVPSLAMPP